MIYPCEHAKVHLQQIMKNQINILEYGDTAEEVKVKYLGSISYLKIRDIDTLGGHKEDGDERLREELVRL